MANPAVRLSGNGYLYVIEKFAIDVARSIVGGTVTHPNHRLGDLYCENSDSYYEVKASGLSSGPIIEKSQLNRHWRDLEHHNHFYAIVLYENREYEPRTGRYRYLPRRFSQTDLKLEKLLIDRTREVYVVHISVIRAIFRQRRRDIQRYMMARGPKTYLKIYPARLRILFSDPKLLSALGLKPENYRVEKTTAIVRFKDQKFQVKIYRIDVIDMEKETFAP